LAECSAHSARISFAQNSSVSIGHAALDVAIASYPSERFTLRNRALVIREYKPEVRSL
jgi:hypothetical protein